MTLGQATLLQEETEKTVRNFLAAHGIPAEGFESRIVMVPNDNAGPLKGYFKVETKFQLK